MLLWTDCGQQWSFQDGFVVEQELSALIACTWQANSTFPEGIVLEGWLYLYIRASRGRFEDFSTCLVSETYSAFKYFAWPLSRHSTVAIFGTFVSAAVIELLLLHLIWLHCVTSFIVCQYNVLKWHWSVVVIYWFNKLVLDVTIGLQAAEGLAGYEVSPVNGSTPPGLSYAVFSTIPIFAFIVNIMYSQQTVSCCKSCRRGFPRRWRDPGCDGGKPGTITWANLGFEPRPMSHHCHQN